ncbi:MAG: MFS transporter [Nocardiopsaceae bacterium]|nr:MFS transporter [Nocardiopsaceae bacterium]
MAGTGESTRARGTLGGLWRRQLTGYPDTPTRAMYLTIVVLAAIVVFYEFYVAASVSPAIIAGDNMTFPFYAYVMAAASAAGALGSLAAGVADRWGRANLIAYGLLANGVLTLFGVPNTTDKWEFAVVFAIIAYIGGVILVATPALVRDFAQRLGRASAMGLWALGPVVGSLVVAVVSSLTLGRLHPWRDQFVICGVAGLVVGLIAVGFLRELSPRLREQVKASLGERVLAEARARGIDVADQPGRPWRQVLRPDVIGAAFGGAVFLLVYYTAVVFLTVYFTAVRGLSLPSANSLGDWFWAFCAGALILAGIASDVVRVRKPFMVAGAAGGIAMTIVLGNLGAGTPYRTFAVVVSALAVCLAIAFVAWMASFTETVERHNPALTGTGLAVWSWLVWVVVAVSLLVLPSVVTSMTSLVAQGSGGRPAPAAAVAAASRQWRDWLWACAAGQAVFLPFVFVLAGRWSPRKAREDATEYERLVQRELEALRAES